MNRRRTWTPLRRMPLAATGAEHAQWQKEQWQKEQWQILNARSTGCFQLEADLDRRIHGGLRHDLRQDRYRRVGGLTETDPQYVKNLCSPAVDHRQLLELASDIATARASRG